VTTAGPITLGSFGHEAQVAVRAVTEAMQVARSLEGRVTAAAAKADTSPVTVADLAIQALIARRLADDFQNDPVLAEEDASWLRGEPAGVLSAQVVSIVRHVVFDACPEQVIYWIDRGGGKANSRFWTLDPIDGTKGLLHGRQYVIALALVVDGLVQLGVIGCPRLSLTEVGEQSRIREQPGDGGTAVAVRGRGAWWMPGGGEQFVPLRVSTQRDPSAARVFRSYERQHGDSERFDRTLSTLGSKVRSIPMDSQAKHVALAAGAGDLLMRFPPHRHFHDAIWDYAAGSLLIEEAGGRVSDLAGRPLDFTAGRRLLRNEGFLASNDLLHEVALTAIRHVMA
jgi:3'(2'), 5'-bisphosphate nucleotidase